MDTPIRAVRLMAPVCVCAEVLVSVVMLLLNAIQRQYHQSVLHAMQHFANNHCHGVSLPERLEKDLVNVVLRQRVVQLTKQGIGVLKTTRQECVCVVKALYVPREVRLNHVLITLRHQYLLLEICRQLANALGPPAQQHLWGLYHQMEHVVLLQVID